MPTSSQTFLILNEINKNPRRSHFLPTNGQTESSITEPSNFQEKKKSKVGGLSGLHFKIIKLLGACREIYSRSQQNTIHWPNPAHHLCLYRKVCWDPAMLTAYILHQWPVRVTASTEPSIVTIRPLYKWPTPNPSHEGEITLPRSVEKLENCSARKVIAQVSRLRQQRTPASSNYW